MGDSPQPHKESDVTEKTECVCACACTRTCTHTHTHTDAILPVETGHHF